MAGSLSAKVDELASSIASDEADLKAATGIRAKEAADFSAEEKELSEVIDMLGRAIGILEREMQKGGSALLQVKDAASVTDALKVLVQASVFSSQDAAKLTALVQASQQSEDDSADEEFGAPAAAVYEGHSGDIISTLEGLLEKAESQLAEARKKETSNLHNFEMMKQSLEDEIRFANKDLGGAKQGLAKSGEAKATAEGDLDVTTKDLKSDTKALADLHRDCMTKAQDYEAATKSRGEELTALAEAKKVISETTGGADKVVYGLNQVSFVQLGRSELSSSADLAKYEAVRIIRDLARRQHSSALAQLASRAASALRSGDDPFGKVKGLISDMIEKLEDEAGAEASHKAYCDKELAEASTKKSEKESEIEKLTTKIDQASARAAQLKEEVAALQKSLSELASAQASMDKMRSEEHEIFVSNEADLKKGLDGVKLALKVLREYYGQAEGAAHAAAAGAGKSVIGLLEVCESDLSKSLAEATASDDSAAATYESESKENTIEKTSKEQDVKYKTKEAASLDKAVAETSSDRASVQDELDAVLSSLKALNAECVAKAETYEERKARREAEIAGLKEALSVLENEAALIQRQSRRTLRGRRSPQQALA
uniref:Uncharacterized protein n=1 Tax=Alexandrium andersonii TaxID=327968 RepID=A0A7S2ACU5_9DINO